MNNDLNSSDQNLHRSLFSTSDLKKSQIARTIRHNSKEIINREAFRDSDGKYNHDNISFVMIPRAATIVATEIKSKKKTNTLKF